MPTNKQVWVFSVMDRNWSFSSRGQTLRWIGAKFGDCRSLESRVMTLRFCQNDQIKLKNKGRTKRATLLRNPRTVHN